MAGDKPQAGQLFRVKEGFAIPGGPDGFMRAYPTGALVDGGDPVATSHGHMMEPASTAVEAATAAPGERRLLGRVRLPSGGSVADVTQHRTGHAHQVGAAGVRTPTNVDQHEGAPDMVHALPPDHPDSPASVHAPLQPGLGVVADDADERGQNLAGGPKSSKAPAAVEKVAAKSVKAQAGEGSGEIGTAVAQGVDASGAGSDETGSTGTPEPDKQQGAQASSGRSGGRRGGSSGS